MADFQISDNVGNSVTGVPNPVNSVGSLKKYVVAESLHLLVIPDLVKVSDNKLSEATQGRPLQLHWMSNTAFNSVQLVRRFPLLRNPRSRSR